ncbi:MAG: subtype B tannase [Capnocytophaga sp.]|nr:subtype B tannase [Capnocytophaga sp.]
MKRIIIAGFTTFIVVSCKTLVSQKQQKLQFDDKKYTLQEVNYEGKTIKFRAYEGIVYVENPVDTTYQKMNVYIPQEYYENKSINGFTAVSAPIFFPNKVGGYMPAQPASILQKEKRSSNGKGVSAEVVALSQGYIVASAGARGRTNGNGKAPAGIVDLKAALRYLHFNDKNMPGNAQKIISNGTSAGGAMSALLGASGDSKKYDFYLKEIGAAEASDAIFAVSAYCPITNLENADMAYEWQFNKVNDYKKIEIAMLDYNVQRKEIAGTLTAEEQQTSDQLKKNFPSYVNSLQLKNAEGETLTLDNQGNGNFKELIKKYIIASAQKELLKGSDMSKYSFLTIENDEVKDIDFENYVRYMERMKMPPAFDGLDLSNGENQLFGDAQTDKKHFTTFSFNNSTVKGTMATSEVIYLMNPMNFIANKTAKTAKHWRIRHGSKDRDTGLAIATLLATSLQNHGYSVDLAFPWDKPHSGDYDLDELFDWMNSIVK